MNWPFNGMNNFWFWFTICTIVRLVRTVKRDVWPEVKIWWRCRKRGITVLLPEDEETP